MNLVQSTKAWRDCLPRARGVAGLLLIVLADIPSLRAVAPPPLAKADPNDANTTLYERPLNAVAKPPDVFPELKKNTEGYWLVDFRHLASFTFEAIQVPTPAKPDGAKPGGSLQPDAVMADLLGQVGSVNRIPPEVQALEGKRVAISGYMLPVNFDEKGFVKEFLIIRSPMVCCYGVAPRLNEWVVVKMDSKAKKIVPMMDVPLDFYGTLHVGEKYEGGVFTGLYRLEGEKTGFHSGQ